MALCDLQVAPQAGQIQRGGGLADAAADLIHRLALYIGGGGLVAPGGGALAHHAVVGEHIAGVQHIAVDRGGGQLHIALPRRRAAHLGGGGAKHIPE